MTIDWVARILVFISLLIAIVTVYLNYKAQRTSLIHDLASKRLEIYPRREGEGSKAYEERIINFFEYIALLVIKKEVSETVAKELFYDDFCNLFRCHEKMIKENSSWHYIHLLTNKWGIRKMENSESKKHENSEIKDTLNEISESTKLSTVDNVILALIFFILSFGLALLSLGIPQSLINNSYLFVGAITFFVFVVTLFAYLFLYVQALFSKKGGFHGRVTVLVYLIIGSIFILGIWLLLFIASIYEQFYKQLIPEWLTISLIIILLIVCISYSYLRIRPKIWNYFERNCQRLLENEKRN